MNRSLKRQAEFQLDPADLSIEVKENKLEKVDFIEKPEFREEEKCSAEE